MSLLVIWPWNRNYMLMLSKHLINKKKYFLACFAKRMCDFKNAIFKIVLIKITLPNGPLKVLFFKRNSKYVLNIICVPLIDL